MFLSPGSRARNKGGFSKGTQLMFVNAAAPLGWTRVTTFDDALLRIVGSATPASGGANGFVATVNGQTVTGTGTTGTGTTGTGTTGTGTTGTGTSGGTSLTIANLAAHAHGINVDGSGSAGGTNTNTVLSGASTTVAPTGPPILNSGSGTTHTHTVPGLSVPGLSVPGLSVPGLTVPALSVTFGIKYVDSLIAKKN